MTFQQWWAQSRWANVPWSQTKTASQEAWDEAIRQTTPVREPATPAQIRASIEQARGDTASTAGEGIIHNW